MTNIVGRDNGSKDSVNDQEQKDPCCNNRGLVLGEAQHCVCEESPGLGVQLLVGQASIKLNKLEFLLGNLFNVIHIIIHHFLDPILIRGSIKP